MFDPVLEMVLDDEVPVPTEEGWRPFRLCYHCQKRIQGKQYQIDDKFFDAYCWQFRFSIGAVSKGKGFQPGDQQGERSQ